MAISSRWIIGIFFIFKSSFYSDHLIASDLNPVIITEDTSIIDFKAHVKYFVDVENGFTEINLMDKEFLQMFSNNYNGELLSGGDIWSHFLIHNTSELSNEYILEVGGFNIVKVFYKPSHHTVFAEKTTGRYVPFPKNELANINYRDNKVKIKLIPGTTYEFIVHYIVAGNEKVRPEFSIFSKEKWLFKVYKSFTSRNLLLGLFFGISAVLAIINFIYYFIHKDKSYLIYSFYILSLLYYELSIYDVFDNTFLIYYPILLLAFENTALLLSAILYILFLKKFIDTKNRLPLWDKVANFQMLYLVIGILLSSWFLVITQYPQTAYFIRNLFLLILIPSAAIFLFKIYTKGNKIDHIFIIGTSVLVGFGLLSLAAYLLNSYLISDLLFQVGIVIELIIFSIGLGVKSKNHQKEKQFAQLNLIDQLKENERLQLSINLDLETQVNERTKEIQTQNEELIQQQEEIAAHRDKLENQNKIIAEHMRELESIKSQLEEIVTERTQQLKLVNNKLIQHNNQLEQYAYITAHNLRAPVARLKGLMYILEKTSGINKQNKDVIRRIIFSAQEMDEVLTDMNAILELKYKENGRLQKVDVKEIVEKVNKRVSENLIDAKGKLQLNLDVQFINANAPYLESIIYNLVSNAIKYRSVSRELSVRISSEIINGEVILKISDNGRGIDLFKFREKIFGLYQRFHDHIDGKGLGLYLVKTQVEALGGKIDIESKVGKGTTFIVSLPA